MLPVSHCSTPYLIPLPQVPGWQIQLSNELIVQEYPGSNDLHVGQPVPSQSSPNYARAFPQAGAHFPMNFTKGGATSG